VVRELVAGVTPLDEHEARDAADMLQWIESGASLFRITPPATPDKHICVYLALLDDTRHSVLLVDHIKAGLWLFPGGHVDEHEDPRTTVLREGAEELGIAGRFQHPHRSSDPVTLVATSV